jgi:hypothetical protein
VDEPSPWQREQVAAHLADSLPDLAARLNRLVGGGIEVEAVTVEPLREGLPPASAPVALATAMVAAALGHAAPASVDLAAPAEVAVLRLLLAAALEWAAPFDAPAGADVSLSIAVSCLSVRGAIEVAASWDALSALVPTDPPCALRGADVPVASAVVAVEALLPGPDLAAADVLNLKEGDVLLSPAGSSGSLYLQAGDVRLGTASLGAVSGHLAARLVEAFRRDPLDASD